MKRLLVALLLVVSSVISAQAQTLKYPVTPKVDQVDHYFGNSVADPYRWLENVDTLPVKQWVEEQNKVTFDYLSKIPFRDKIKTRLEEIWNFPKYSAPFKAGSYYFFSKNDGLQNQSVLYRQQGLSAAPTVFLDPNKLSEDGTVALTGTYVSNDEKYLAYAIARSGSDWNEIYVMDIASGKQLSDRVEWVKFSGASWFRDGFFYSRYDAPKDGAYSKKNEYHKVYYHKLGTDQSADALVFEDLTTPTRSHFVFTDEDERFQFLYKAEGSKKGALFYVKDVKRGDKEWRPIVSEFGDNNNIVESLGDRILMITDRDAPKKRLVLVDPNNPAPAAWETVVPESKSDVMEAVSLIGGKLLVTYMKDANHKIVAYSTEGKRLHDVALPALGSADGFTGRKRDNEVFYTFTSFSYPHTIYRYDVEKNTSTLFRKSDVKFDPADYVTKQVFYPSKDGTKVPMFIIHKKGLIMSGKNPTLLYGYGGFNNSMTPYFSTSRMILLENGGVFALANIRGGGEYGEEWHEGGMKLKKQNSFNDFAAAAEYLIREKYTSPEKLALQGASNGGLLVGALMVQRPDLFRVAFPAVGVMDMLRYHKFTIGWAWAKEYGSSDDSTDFANIYRYSPLHNLKAGVRYPATMVTTADHDDRVVPAHSFKFIATLQERHAGTEPVLIRIDTKAGHGSGKPMSKIVEEIADTYAFMFYNMGVTPKY